MITPLEIVSPKAVRADRISGKSVSIELFIAETKGRRPGNGRGGVVPQCRAEPLGRRGFDARKVRRQFPILRRSVNGRHPVYLDNLMAPQKPLAVFDAIARYYARGDPEKGREASRPGRAAVRLREDARETVRQFLNANEAHEILFVRGTVEAMDLVARTHGRARLHAGDEILVAGMEHPSDVEPWRKLCEERGAILQFVSITDRGEIQMEKLRKRLSARTRLVIVPHVSDVFGTINPVRSIIRMAHDREIPVLVDGARAVPHLEVDVLDLDCDFYAFSGCNLYGPDGVGVLYAKARWLNTLGAGPDRERRTRTAGAPVPALPDEFEAATPSLAGAMGLAAAIGFLQSFHREEVLAYERELMRYAVDALSGTDGLRVVGPGAGRIGILSFVMRDVHANELSGLLNRRGIVVRAVRAEIPSLTRRIHATATVCASLALYNTREEVDELVAGLRSVKRKFA